VESAVPGHGRHILFGCWTPLLVILGLYAVVRESEGSSNGLIFAAGLALGATAGFKLVNSVYAIALFLTFASVSAGPASPGES